MQTRQALRQRKVQILQEKGKKRVEPGYDFVLNQRLEYEENC